MGLNKTGFTDAIYHRQDCFDFEETVFSFRMLKTLLLVDGKRSAAEISEILSIETYALMPEFANLVEMGLIQTKVRVIPAGVSGLFCSNNTEPQAESTIA